MLKPFYLLTMFVIAPFMSQTCLAEDAYLSAPQQQINFRNVVSLSHVITPTIPLWPGDPPVSFDVVASFPVEGYYLRKFSIGEHSATHINAPNSFIEGAQSIDQYSAKQLLLHAIVIDVRDKVKKNADYAFSRDDFIEWERKHGWVPAGSFVILYTGWQERWNNPKAFFNQDKDGALHFPGFAASATEFLLSSRKISGVGIDTHGVDPGLDTNFSTNKLVLAQKGISIECMTNLDKLAQRGNTLIVGSLRLKDGSGSPVAITALVP